MPTNRRLGDDLIAERNRFARQVVILARPRGMDLGYNTT